jgi:hypothetical protein
MGGWGNFSIEESNGRPGAHRLGDQEREDLNEVATVATWEITPFHSNDGWSLTIIVEDQVGP